MRMDDTLENRQNNEFEALRSMYCDDVKDLRTNTKCDSLDFVINLKPQRGSNTEVYVQIDLHVRCSPQYPNEIPQIFLEKNKGISSLLVDQLHQELLNLAKSCLGNEMFLQLCEHIQEFLYKHNKPRCNSFYDEMCQRKKMEEMKSQKAKELEKDKEWKIFNEEVERRYSTLEQEKYRKKSNSVSVEENVISRQNSALSNRRKSSSNDSSGEFSCSHKRSDNIFFENNGPKEIIRGNCLRHTSYFRSVYCGIDKETGEYLIVNEWRVPVSDVDTQVNKQVQNIEREFKKMKGIKHANLTPYINFSWNIDDEYLVIYVLRQFVDGMSCRSLFVNTDIKVDITVIKYIAIGVLRALNSLHEKDVIHRSVKDTCIYINTEGAVKVSNFNIHRKLTDLFNNTPTVAYGKKVDVFKFGLLLLGLIKGKTLTEDDDISIPDSLQSDLHDFLTKCLSEDEKYRFSVSQLLDHQFCSQNPAVEVLLDQKLIDINQELDLHNDALQDHIRDGSRNQSRIRNEFEFIESIGEGAFGTVCKYRNKLDSQFYAIKKIKLNPRDKQLNKKTVREVKLLSRLNHENVVRYYNSWIESEIADGESSETGSSDDLATSKKMEEFTISDNVEGLAPPAINTKVSITYDSKSQVTYEDSSDSDSSEDDEDNNSCTTSYNKESESDGIEFQNTKGTTVGGDKESSRSDDENQSQSVVRIDSMYIQMEFCEKSTLKSAIDDNLYLDNPRMLRLFREILEGLAHIHKQGMIHRDLKPVNIFLDVKGRVKIGDFGLATTSLRSRLNDDNPTKSSLDSAKEEHVEESKTGRIGTPFYVAPELNVHSKPVYNEKVDIYSLGIILFEMCHKPPETLMERCAILKQLRHKEIIFPKNFTSSLLGKHEFLIRWLLNHDPSKRPTSLELLQSEHVPPPILEEKKLMDLIRHTLNNPQSKGYKFLVASCFEQNFRLAEDVTYDRDVNNIASPKTLEHYYELVKDITVKVFKKHGAQNLPTPLLLPSGKCYTFHNHEDNCVRLMTNNGDVVVLPYDLRVPFARYIAWNHISLLRRYSIERVYREKKVFGFAPTELYECAFDIVTPTPGSLLSDGEILYIVYDIFTQLPVLKNKRITIRLNHKLLVEFILNHYKIKLTDRTKFIQMSHEFRENKLSRNDYSSYLFSLGLTDASVTALTTLISNDHENVTNGMQMIVKRNNTEYSKYVNPAIKDLKKIEQAAKAMGLEFDVVFAPGLLYKIQQFSGMICQFVCQSAKRKYDRTEILAVGGRYDRMISDYRDMQRANVLFKEIPQSAVGISISLDKIVQIIQKEELLEEDCIGHFDVMLCTVGSERRLNDKVKIISSLSSAEVRWTFLEAGSLKEIEEYSEELRVPNVIILKDNDEEKVILRSREKERFQEKAYSVLELMDEIPKLVKSSSNNEISLSKSDSRVYVEKSQPSSSVDIVFYTSEKISVKKRYESQILNLLNEISIPLHGEVIVIALDVDISVIKTLVANLEFQTDEIFDRTVESVIEKHSRQKKVLRGICDQIYMYKKKSAKSFLFLYSLKDLACKLIM